MSLAYRCEVCDGNPAWQILRRGDVAVRRSRMCRDGGLDRHSVTL